jgi:flagella basal body P-ring formation protein FlgA
VTGRVSAVLAIGALAAGLAAHAAEVTVRMRAEVVVERDDLVLGDLAQVEGLDPLAAQVRAVRLGLAPVAGASQRLELDYLRLRIRQHQIDPGRIEIVAAERTVVTRAFQDLSGDAIVEAATRHALAWLETRDPERGPYALSPVSRPPDRRLPTGPLELRVQLPPDTSGATLLPLTVGIRVDGRDHALVPLTLRIGRLQRVVVASRPLEPRAPVSLADFRLEARASHAVPPGALPAISDVTDLEATRSIRAGDVVTQPMLRARALVRRGERVTLLVEGPGFRITMVGQAEEDARRGEAVRVTNLTSKREVVGQVESAGVVRVNY